VTVKTAYMYAWGSLAFWAPRGAADASTVAARLAGEVTFPLDPVPRAVRGLLVSAVPTGLFAWLPSRALLGLGAPVELWATPTAAAVLSGLAILLFRAGMRHYHRTGSRRYAGIGQGR
jgi:ABC-2 type transport system permease protein